MGTVYKVVRVAEERWGIAEERWVSSFLGTSDLNLVRERLEVGVYLEYRLQERTQGVIGPIFVFTTPPTIAEFSHVTDGSPGCRYRVLRCSTRCNPRPLYQLPLIGAARNSLHLIKLFWSHPARDAIKNGFYKNFALVRSLVPTKASEELGMPVPDTEYHRILGKLVRSDKVQS